MSRPSWCWSCPWVMTEFGSTVMTTYGLVALFVAWHRVTRGRGRLSGAADLPPVPPESALSPLPPLVSPPAGPGCTAICWAIDPETLLLVVVHENAVVAPVAAITRSTAMLDTREPGAELVDLDCLTAVPDGDTLVPMLRAPDWLMPTSPTVRPPAGADVSVFDTKGLVVAPVCAGSTMTGVVPS